MHFLHVPSSSQPQITIMEMYDFIIFEHTGLRNHMVDLCNIGQLLIDSGLKVAIANVTNERELCSDSGIEILNINVKRESYKTSCSYMKAVIKELSPQTKNFYVGSILSSTSLMWLKYVPPHHKVFLWALRSFFFTQYRRFRMSRTYLLDVIHSIYNSWVIHKRKNTYLFVSDTIIRDEFINLGYERERLIVRPERTTKEIHPVKQGNNTPLTLLSIGALRPEKRLELCIDAIDAIGSQGFHLIIAGKAYTINGYDKMLEARSARNPFVTRIPYRLSTEEYNKLIIDCDYLILCDEKQPSSVTNGTMAEALLSGRPIIAPNYNPYKSIIEKYRVGILYEMYNQESLKKALIQAKETNPSEFSEGILNYQQDFLYDNVVSNFEKEINSKII